MATPVDCAICCEPLNMSTRKPVDCNFCDAVACSTCVQRYLLSVDEPECMACKRPWTSGVLESKLTKAFVKGALKKHREQVLLNREKSLLPSTQLELERLKQRDVVQQEVRVIEQALFRAKERLRLLSRAYSLPLEEERRRFIKPCPGAGCRGFLSTQYRCGLCGLAVCPDCHEPKARDGADGQQHECDPDMVASVRAIQSDSKPCPKCGTYIFRMFGCDQMFCTAPGCHTAFCWRTLRILDTRRVHNPHYYEYLQQQRGGGPIGRELDDIPCGGMPSARALQQVLLTSRLGQHARYSAGPNSNEVILQYRELFVIHRFAMHVQDVEMRRYPASPDVVNPDVNRDVRLKYLAGEMSEEQLKAVLHRREKARKLHDSINQVLATFANVSSDLFRRVVVENAREDVIQDATDQLTALREYANESMCRLSKSYGCAVPFLSRDWATPLRRAHMVP